MGMGQDSAVCCRDRTRRSPAMDRQRPSDPRCESLRWRLAILRRLNPPAGIDGSLARRQRHEEGPSRTGYRQQSSPSRQAVVQGRRADRLLAVDDTPGRRRSVSPSGPQPKTRPAVRRYRARKLNWSTGCSTAFAVRFHRKRTRSMNTKATVGRGHSLDRAEEISPSGRKCGCPTSTFGPGTPNHGHPAPPARNPAATGLIRRFHDG